MDTLQLSEKSIQMFAQMMVSPLLAKIWPKIDQVLSEKSIQEEMLTREQVAKDILHCAPNTADKYYLYQPGFPFFQEGKKRKYYAPAVKDWLAQHQQGEGEN